MQGARIRIVIDLAQGEPEPKGTLNADTEPEIAFAGWIGLSSALESVVSAHMLPDRPRARGG